MASTLNQARFSSKSSQNSFTNFEISKEVILYHETVLDQKDILAFKLNRKL